MKNEAAVADRRMCHPGSSSDNIKTDAEFESCIPPLSPSELADLHRSLDAEGCRDALIVWKSEKLLIDGHNRLRYCREKGYPFPVTEKEFPGRDEAKAYIIHTQLGRRNLSPAAESYLRGKQYLEVKRQGARTDLTSGQSDQKSAAERLGEEFKVGEKTVRRDGKFAEAVDSIVENCGPDVRNLLLSRDTGFSRGGVLRLAKLAPEEQRTFVQGLKESGKRPRKPRKTRRRETITVSAQPKALVRALCQKLKPDMLAAVYKALGEALEGKGASEQEEEATGRPRKRKRKPAQ